MLIRAIFYFICAVVALFTIGMITFFVGYYLFYRKKIKRMRQIKKIRLERTLRTRDFL